MSFVVRCVLSVGLRVLLFRACCLYVLFGSLLCFVCYVVVVVCCSLIVACCVVMVVGGC